MVMGCSIQNCKSRSVKGGTIRFFTFPKNESVANKWLRYCRPKTSTKYGRVCSSHFIDSDYLEPTLRHVLMNYTPKTARKLKPDALPTLKIDGIDIDKQNTHNTTINQIGDTSDNHNNLTQCNTIPAQDVAGPSKIVEKRDETSDNFNSLTQCNTITAQGVAEPSEVVEKSNYVIANDARSSVAPEDPLKVTIEDVKPVVACRGCLVTEQPLRPLDDQLADAFSMFISTVEEHDIYPKYICMYCRAVLLRFVSFRKKCLTVQSDLTKVALLGIPITLDFIKTFYTSYPLTTTKPALISLGYGKSLISPSFMQNIGEKPSNPIPTKKQQNVPNYPQYKLQIKNEDKIKIEIIPEPDNEIIIDGDNYYNANDDSDDTDLQDCMKDTKQHWIWIDTVKAKAEDQTSPSIQKVKITKKLTEQQKQYREKVAKEKADFQNKFYVKIVAISKDQQIQQINQRQYTDKYKNAGYKCELCYSGFVIKDAYENHMARHKPVERQVMCDICKKYYPRIKLTAHIRDFHKEDYVCNICDHISKSRFGARTHYLWHKGIKYDCKICGKLFDKPNYVGNHMHYSHQQHMVKCTICSKPYIGQRGLRAHMNLSHKEAKDAVCASCGVQFYSVSAMQRHRPQGDCDHTHSPCTACGMGFTSDSLLREHKSHCEFKMEYECEACDIRFDDVARYRSHMRHKHQNPLICEFCGKRCSTHQSLKVHVRQHTGKPNFCCDYCGKGYYYKMFLVNHMSKHTGLQPTNSYHCEYCHKKFSHPSTARRHENAVHKGLRPFACDICRRTFQTKEGMHNHVRHTHEGVPWPKRVRHRFRQ